jgi:negative regulator of flagellin synthesis FlgM
MAVERTMSPIDISGAKASLRVDPERQEARVRSDETAPSSSTSAATKPADSVQLTDTAARLSELQAEVNAAEGVDLERVEAIREQIADGSYEVDADRIADALMTMEKELL